MLSIPPTTDEVAAALAAINELLWPVEPSRRPMLLSAWRAGTKLSQQGFPPVKVSLVPTWGTIERLRRL
ncbi:MAG: hypothetical protein H0X37_10700 [Herpetosiphonaceae bacterium]|nr:hypothetical protein [Herpetosiphonaceae bacterium]